MRFLNAMEIDDLAVAYGRNANNIGKAVRLLVAVRDHADANSDGWCYWPKPARACGKLIELLERCRAVPVGVYGPPAQPTDKELNAAIAPIKAFYTKARRDTDGRYPVFPG